MSMPVAENNQAPAATSQTTDFRLNYAWYVVFVLMVCLTLSFIDRQILSLLVGPIKRDLGVNDTAIGLLHGFWFALFYTFMGLPVGWLVDRYSRRAIIAWGVFFWRLMTS